MQRSVRKHHSQARVPGGDMSRDCCAVAALQKNDGTARTVEQSAIRCGDKAVALDSADVAGHNRERLSAAALPFAKQGDSAIIGCVARQMEAAESFDCEDFAACKKVAGSLQNGFAFDACDEIRYSALRQLPGREQRQTRTALGTSVRLGVK